MLLHEKGVFPRPFAILLAVIAAARPHPAGADPAVYALDNAESRFTLQVNPAGIAGRMGLLHEHVFVPDEVRGVIRFDPDVPEAAGAVVKADARTLRDEQDSLSESDRRTVRRQVRELLETKRHPWLSLTVERFEVEEETGSSWSGTLHGLLTLAGNRRSVEIPVEATLDGQTLEAEGTFRFRTSEFGIRPEASLFGAIDVQDQVTLRYRLIARPDRAAN